MARKPVRRPRKPKPPLLQRLRNDFLTGLVVVLPMFLTAYIVWWFVGFVDDKVVPLIPRRYDPENIFGRNIFGFGLLLFVTFTTLVGALAKNLIGRQILQFGETILSRTPIVRPIYNGLKQIAETLFTETGNSFQQACLVEYPRKGTWSVAFMSTARAPRDPRAHRRRPRLGLRADDPEPDHRLPALRAARRDRAARHEPRGRDQAHHLRRPRHRADAARPRPQAARRRLTGAARPSG